MKINGYRDAGAAEKHATGAKTGALAGQIGGNGSVWNQMALFHLATLADEFAPASA
jgi:hypothetical protein